ncbi:MAG: hypothetical protein WBE73_19965, partial [Candidatus Acidiferrum sp.]
MRHAALRAQQQHIIWQEVIIKLESTPRPSLSQKEGHHNLWMHDIQKSNPQIRSPKGYCAAVAFFDADAALGRT